jgi:hypothetical protein
MIDLLFQGFACYILKIMQMRVHNRSLLCKKIPLNKEEVGEFKRTLIQKTSLKGERSPDTSILLF